jgi:SecD/SecF fusion protein
MSSDDPVLTALADANPVPAGVKPGDQERAEAERIRSRVLSSPPPSRHRARVIAPLVSTLVVLAVVAVFLRAGGTGHSAAPAHSRTKVVLQVFPTAQTPVLSRTAMTSEAQIIRDRLRPLGASFRVTVIGGDRIAVTSGELATSSRGRIIQAITTTAELSFYDWEANVLTPNGQTVASQLETRDPAALKISQGLDFGPGQPGAGSMSLYDAVVLASKQPTAPHSSSLSRIGPQYFMFGGPGSAACAAAARESDTQPIQGEHCLLGGPDSEPPGTTRQRAVTALAQDLPAGVSAAEAQVLAVPQGTVVLQAANPSASTQIKLTNPSAQFYVLKDHVSLFGNDLTNPHQSTDQSGAPDIQFGFTSSGQNAFQRVTAKIARRGANVSLGSNAYPQHFAVALNGQLITIPSIDYKQYPDGISGGGGADITGAFTVGSARRIATELRYGGLPLQVRSAG